MTTAMRITATKKVPMDSMRETALVAAPILIIAVLVTLFRGTVPPPSLAVLAALPVAAWELSLGLWLVVKGFKPSPITAGMEAASSAPAYHDVTA